LAKCSHLSKLYGNLITFSSHETFGCTPATPVDQSQGPLRGLSYVSQNQPAASWLGWLAALANAFTGATLVPWAIGIAHAQPS